MSESGVTSEKKVYRVPSTMKKVTMCLTRGSYSTFARSAVKIPQLKTALVAAVAGLVRNEEVYYKFISGHLAKVYSKFISGGQMQLRLGIWQRRIGSKV